MPGDLFLVERDGAIGYFAIPGYHGVVRPLALDRASDKSHVGRFMEQLYASIRA